VKLRTRLHLVGTGSVLVALALVATVLWGASVASDVLASRQAAARRAENFGELSVTLPALAFGGIDAKEHAISALERAARTMPPAGGREELEALRQAVDALPGLDPAAATTAPRAGPDLVLALGRLAAWERRRDAETSQRTADAIASARVVAAILASLILSLALLGVTGIAPRLRRGLAALEAGARRISAGDLSNRIALPGRDELASVSQAIDAMADRLEGLLATREQTEALMRARTIELERAQRESAERVEQLESVRIELDASDRLVAADRLARGLTHELNNPLAILLADVEFASEELQAYDGGASASLDEARTALGEARQAGRRIALIVRELMSFSRDRAAGDRDLADLVETLEHSARLAGPEIRRHGAFVTDLPAGPILVQGSQARLGQAFLELLLGAASAVAGSAPARGTVSLALWAEPSGAMVEIRDDGEPIPSDLRDHLFDPFYVATPGFTSGGARMRGTGLGLASCARIVQAAGGRIEVESPKAAGTVFRVWLPAPTSLARVALSRQAGSPGASRRRLLVVDGDPFECAAAYRTLSKAFDVAPHATVSSALAALRAGGRYDLILCDPASAADLGEALAADGSPQVEALVQVGGDGGATDGEPAAPPRLSRPISVEQVGAWLASRVRLA